MSCIALFLGRSTLGLAAPVVSKGTTRPNILMIVSDDHARTD